MIDRFDNNPYNKHLQPHANKLRKQMAKAEACLWKYVLRATQLKGFQARRQRPVLNYIADDVYSYPEDWIEKFLKYHRPIHPHS